MFDLIAFDADDTLWHNETLFQATAREFAALLARHHPPEWIQERLFATELKNLRHFGYGIKGYTLSMIETSVELTEGRVTGAEIQTIRVGAMPCCRRPSPCSTACARRSGLSPASTV